MSATISIPWEFLTDSKTFHGIYIKYNAHRNIILGGAGMGGEGRGREGERERGRGEKGVGG